MAASSSSVSGLLAAWLAPFACLVTRPTWGRVPVLIEGTLLAVHRRTVSAALRATGRDRAPDFARYHRVLNQACGSARAAARVLLGALVTAFVPNGIYRDPVRSSHGHFVKASGLRWASLSLLAPIPPGPDPPWPRSPRPSGRARLGGARLGGARLGAAVRDRPRALGTVCRGAGQDAQEADGLGQAGPAPGRALAAGQAHRRGHRQRLCRPRTCAAASGVGCAW